MSTAESTDQLVRQALHAATRAPSPHNTQPWLFRINGDVIDVWLDPERILRVADPGGREARLACGAAAFNLQLSLRVAGQDATIQVQPDRGNTWHVARVRLAHRYQPSAAEQTLRAAIDRRTSNRRPFLDRAVPGWLRLQLVTAALNEGARLHLLDHPALSSMADLIRQADQMQAEDEDFQEELSAWIAEHPDRTDGVPHSAGGPHSTGNGFLALRHYRPLESTVDRQFEQDPLIAVLATGTDTLADQVWAGMAMQRVMLVATASGLSASFVTQPIEVDLTRAGLRALLGGRDHPQTVLRIGYGFATASTPRRSANEVTRLSTEDIT